MTFGRHMVIATALCVPLLATTGSSPALAQVEESSSDCLAVPNAVEGDVAVVNITPARAEGTGYGALRPQGAPPVYSRSEGQYSSVNFAADTPPNPNLALVAVGTNGRICYDGGVANHDVALDIAAVIPGDKINAIDPTRLIDTRDGGTQVGPSNTVCLAVPGAAPGDTAVVNITPTRAAGTGFGSLRAQGTTPIYDRATADQYSSVNFAANTPANPNLAFVAIGTNSEICYDGGGAFHDVILDLSAVIPGDVISPIEPLRLFDSRDGAVRMTPGGQACITMNRLEGIPVASGDIAVINITPTRPQGPGFGTLLPRGAPMIINRPPEEQFSSVNFAANTPPNPNLAMVEVSDDFGICYEGSRSVHDVILDLAAIIPKDAINATTPTRLLDTRGPAGAIPIEVDVTFLAGSSVAAVYPDYPQFGLGVAHNGHTENPANNQRGGSVEVGTVRGYIVDNGDGTISGSGFIENRWGRASGASFSTVQGSDEIVENYNFHYDGFAVQCPESAITEPPGLYVFQSYVPVTFSGTTEVLGHELFGGFETFYQISMSAGVGAQPGQPGAVPELEVVIDTLDDCAAGYAACEDRVSTQPCGRPGLETADLVLAERDQYVIDHLRINEALVENFGIDTPGQRITESERTNFQMIAANNDQVQLSVRLGY